MIECLRNDVGLAQVALHRRRDSLSRGNLHLDGDVLEMMVDDASEDAWEHEGVVDLVREVAAAGADDGYACFLGLDWVDLGVGVG